MLRPHQDDRKLYNIPDSQERLNLHYIGDVLKLCGGNAGARYSTQVVTMPSF